MAYLETMGIEMFVPRWVLPAAKSPRQALLPEADVPGNGNSDTSNEDHQSATPSLKIHHQPNETNQAHPVGGLVSDILGELSGRKTASDSPKSSIMKLTDQAVSPGKRVLEGVFSSEAETPAPHFSLSLWRVHDDLLVIDSRQSQEALPTAALLSNILFAKGMSRTLPKAEILNWPMAGTVSQSGWPEANEMVQAFLRARFDHKPAQTVWLMGEAACRAVCGEGALFSECMGQMRDVNDLSCLAVILPSLADMLKTPALKAPAWHAIKAQKFE